MVEGRDEPTLLEIEALYAELGSTRAVSRHLRACGFDRSHEWVRARVKDLSPAVAVTLTEDQFREDMRRHKLRHDLAAAARGWSEGRYRMALDRGGIDVSTRRRIMREERMLATVRDVDAVEEGLGRPATSTDIQQRRALWMRVWRGFGSWKGFQSYRRNLSSMPDRHVKRRGMVRGSRAARGVTHEGR